MNLKISLSTQFKKDLKRIEKQGKDLRKLDELVKLLASEEAIDGKYRDHALTDSRKFKNCRECHIEPDWLLVYRKEKTELILALVQTGSHSYLFRK